MQTTSSSSQTQKPDAQVLLGAPALACFGAHSSHMKG